MILTVDVQIFNRLKSTSAGVQALEEKLIPIKGDITLPKLGVCEDDMRELSEQVGIVFNSAATIRFSEPLDVAVTNNIYSVGQLVEFCNGLEKLNALVHLSTAYSNCHKRDTIREVFYEPPMRGDQIIDAIQSLERMKNQLRTYPVSEISVREPDGEQLELQSFYRQRRDRPEPDKLASEQPDLLARFTEIALEGSNKPNTYTFTKAISERYLLDLIQARPDRYLGKTGIAVAIVRPSIVGGAWREPERGFVDNFNGPTGAVLSLHSGALQAMPGDGNLVTDMVPIDMVINMIICTGWFLATKNSALCGAKADKGVHIFNYVSSYRNPLRWHQVSDMIAEVSYKYPTKQLVRLPSSYFIRAGKFYDLYDALNHKLPALLLDLFRRRVLKEKLTSSSSLYATSEKIKRMTDALTPFCSHQWSFDDSNVVALYKGLAKSDQSLFPFDTSVINWSKYIRNYIIGSRIYALRDDPRNVPAALKALRK